MTTSSAGSNRTTKEKTMPRLNRKAIHIPRGVHAPQELRRQAQRSPRLKSAETVLSAMRKRDLALHLEHNARGRDHWTLSDGREVAEQVGRPIHHTQIASVGDPLFKGMPAQAYRFAE
jgi:hypothetical protein